MSLTNTWKNSLTQSLVFIDSNLPDYQVLADGVNNNAEVIILERARNGIEQINETLHTLPSRKGLIESIQIFSHGSPGSLQLGNSFLNADNLESYQQLLSSWKNTLTKKANILLYGCQVAADVGAEFVRQLQQIIGVNIAASVNLTGSSKLGGNWDLEFSTREILVPIALTEIARENYLGVLATLTVTNSNDSGVGSLRQAIATAETGDSITFDASLANQTITLSSGQLDIDKDLIIDGADAAGLTISGNNASRIFETGFETNFTLRNLTIANGKTTQSGEAGAGAGIKTGNSTTLVVENSEFNNNTAGGEGGGAIFAGFQGNTTIINSKFDNNDGTPDNNERGGGAIATKSAGTLTVRNSEFTNNKGINGGAINHLLGELTVENSTFLNNEATAQSSNTGIFGLGGAIATDGANASGADFGPGSVGGEIIVHGSYFEGNRALNGGAANLFAYPADTVIVEDSSFVGNTAINTSVGGGNGGGIRHDNSEFSITNTTFSENVADTQGGGLWVDDSSPTKITNSTFSGNRVGDETAKDGLGGGMTIFSQAEIINSTFADNFSGGHSAAIFTGDQQQITVANTIFDNNTIGESFPTLENTNRQLLDGGNNLQSPPVQTVNNLDEAKVTANITIADPQLEPLQEINGVLVHPLQAGSPAIDAGTNTNAPTTDQRGEARSLDGDGNGTKVTDIGAYEFVDNALPSTVVTNTKDSGVGSLRQAIATAETGDSITFDASLANLTITLTSGQLEIDKDLIIDGADAAGLTISGNNASRIFDVQFQKVFTLKNLKMLDGRTTQTGIEGNGGAINTSSQVTLTIENSEFLNNVTAGEGGGAISAGHKSNTTIINSKFDGNDATLGESERGGGAIVTNGFASLTIKNSEFTNNKGINGGAINTPSTALTVENSTFINNDTTVGASISSSSSSPRGFGGAIYTDGVSASFGGDNGSIIIRDSLFDSNKGAGSGGAAFLFTYPGDNVIIENTQVLNNSVIFNQIEQAYGGGIRLGTGQSSIDRTTPVQYQITNTTFAGNTAESQGGGLWIDRKLDLTRVDIVNSTFSENKAENPDGTIGLGGAIATFAPTTITNTTIANNYAAQLSGAVYTSESAGFTPDISVSNTIFDRNTAAQANTPKQQTNIQFIDGGGNLQFAAVENNGEVLATANMTAADPQLEPLQEVNGVLVHPLGAGSPAIDAGTNSGAPTTDQRGEARSLDGDGNGSLVTDIGAYEFVDNALPSTVVTNSNDSGVGSLRQAIASAQPGDSITFDASLANQTITLTSGQLEIDKDLIIDGADAAGLTISGNNSSRVIYQPDDINFTLRNLRIADGFTTDKGGAIFTDKRATLTLESVNFENNSAGEGGAITVWHFSKATVNNSTFNNNDSTSIKQVEGGAGAIYARDVELRVNNSEFTNNKGINGGAINSLASWLTVENSQFINNDSTGYGGAVYTDGTGITFNDGTTAGGTVLIRNSNFEGNKAVGAGGGAFLFGYRDQKIVVEDSLFANNTVVEDSGGNAKGGGIRTGNVILTTIKNTTFEGNLAEESGGGLWIDPKSSQSNIINSTFSGNRADNGSDNGIGGAMTIQSPTNIINTTIANNSSRSIGGGILSWDPDNQVPITLQNTILAFNSSDDSRDFTHHSNRQLIDGGNNLQFPGPTDNPTSTPVTENITIADPQLEPLQEINGVLVHPLGAGSPAIDAGTNSGAPTTDQRGEARSLDGDGNGSKVTDIGAYEFVDNTVPENTPPTVTNNAALTLKEGATSTITNAKLQVTDADGDSVTFNIKTLPNNGTLKLNDVAIAVNGKFSQTDIDNGKLTYVHNGGETTGDTVSLSASDGNGGNIGNIDFNVRVNAVNDRPTNIKIDNNSIPENSNAGTVIAQLSTVDAETGDSHSYSLVDDAGGRFAMEGDRLLVADGSKLDFESKRRHNITVQTTDSGTPNKSFQKQLAIQVTDVEEPLQGVNLRGTNAGERLAGTPQEDTLTGAGGNDTLAGKEEGDLLRGGNGRDRLNGGTGQDTMRGGAGNDFYIVDDSNDKVIENPNEGGDQVLSRVSYRLPVNVERLVFSGKDDLEAIGNSIDNRITGNSGNNKLVGAVGNDTMFGNNGADTLSGGRGRDILIGNSGNDLLKGHRGRDRLNGGLGQDTMRGGLDNDVYIVNSRDDKIIENVGEGKDLVKSSTTYRLPANLEGLILTGKDDIDGIGNSQNNTIAGNNGNNQLLGAAGNDTIFGVNGRDTLGGGRGNDLLLGGTDQDILKGHRGSDRLNGFAGDDTLTGGLGNDLFIFNTNEQYRPEELGTDVITDFTQSQGDKILLDKRTFTKLTSDKGNGFNIVNEFETVESDAAAVGSDAFIVYNQTNGNLFYNPNGSNNGLGSGGLFATLTDAPALAESDFLIR